MNYRQINWQNNPSVEVQYVDAKGNPILNSGKPMSVLVNGKNIGDTYDLSSYAKVNGYNVVSGTNELKGTYSQDPQVVKLVLTPIVRPVPSVPDNRPVVTTPVANDEYVSVFPDGGNIQIFNDQGVLIPKGTLDVTSVLSSHYRYINGKKYYQIGNDTWVKADAVYTYQSVSGTATLNENCGLYDIYGHFLGQALKKGTSWKFDRIVTINGIKYYRVGTNVFILVGDNVITTK